MLQALRVTSRYFRHFRTGTASQQPNHLRWYATGASSSPENPQLGSKAAITLRGYQEECIQSVLSHLAKGHRRLGISLATGGGKTVIFTRLIDRVPPPTQHANRTLILVHRRELVEQAARHCADAYPAKSVEIEMGNLHASGTADITIASVRSITSGNRLAKFDPKSFKLLLVDEAHHIVASGYMETLRYFGVLDHANTARAPALVGVSATLFRFDGLRLSDALDHIVYHKDFIDMIGEKWLSNVIFTTVASQADISRVKKGVMGDFQVGSLSRAVNTEEVNEITVRAWLARANARKSTLVFCVDLAHVSDLAAKFRAHGVDAQFVTGDTPTQVRSQRLDAFRNRDYPVLLNCGVFTEGTDIPNIDCVLLARPTRSRNLLVQMIGRGMRLHPGKTNCHVIDMVASLGVGIVTTPTLFGLDPAELVEETDPEGLKALKERKSLEEVNRQPKSIAARPSMPGNKFVTFTDYDSVHDMIDDMSSEGQIRRMSMLSWVLVGHERYVLPVQTGDYLTIETAKHSDKRYRVMITQKLSGSTSESSSRGSPFMRPRQIALSETLPDAIHAADTFAVQKYSWRLLGHSLPWRKGRATEGQMSYINKFRDADNQLRPEDISKGEAGDMITKIRFGARSRFHKLEAARKRALRAHEQMSEIASMRQGEQVAVGPISKLDAVATAGRKKPTAVDL